MVIAVYYKLSPVLELLFNKRLSGTRRKKMRMRIVESPDCAVSERCENKHFPSGALLLVRLCFHPRSNSDHLLPVTQSYTHRVTETRAPSCDRSAGTIHRLNPEREIAKAKAENESCSLKPSPMF